MKNCKKENIDYDIMQNFYYLDNLPADLVYLFDEIDVLTDFCISDNVISENFTKYNNNIINKLNTVFSPLLFRFEENIKFKLDVLIKN